MAVRGPYHGDVGSNTVEADDPVHPWPLDHGLAFEIQT